MKRLLLSFSSLLAVGAVLLGCTGDSDVKRIGRYPLGTRFKVVSPIYAIDGGLRTEDGEQLESLKRWAANFNKNVTLIPVGTTFRLESVVQHKRSSWNTGNYTYYTITVVGIGDQFNGQKFDASALSYQQRTRISYEWEFGDNLLKAD